MKNTKDRTSLVNLKAEGETQTVEVEVIPEFKKPSADVNDETRMKLESLDRQISKKRELIDYEDKLIYNLTDHSESLDRALAASAGVLSALLDLLFVDKIDFRTGRWSDAEANVFLDEALNNRIVKDTNSSGLFKNISDQMTENDNNNLFPIGENFAEKIIYGTINWFSSLIGTDTKLGGPLGKLLKGINESKTSVKLMSKNNVSDGVKKEISNGNLNLTQGLTVINFAKQTLPVLLNECLVRAFYFIHRFFQEVSDNNITSVRDLDLIDWPSTVPFKNRTIVRMITISTTVFSALDIASATVGSALVAGGSIYKFLNSFVLHINFIGLGRLVIALGADLYMGAKLSKERQNRSEMIDEMIKLENVKISYKQKDVWVIAKNTEEVINESYSMISEVDEFAKDSYAETKADLMKIGEGVGKVNEINPGLLDEMKDIIHWE